MPVAVQILLGGSWDLVATYKLTYKWDFNPTCKWGNPLSPYIGIISRVISLVISSY